MLYGRNILLIITGGIAAYKALDLVREFQRQGAQLRCVMTEGAKEFITALSVAALNQHEVYDNLWSLQDETKMGHIRLTREADLVLVAPATANILSKMVHGAADDLATATLLASNKPVMVAPAMNVEMWNNPATQENIRTLQTRGVHVIPPGTGEMACGETGEGRLANAENIIQAVDNFFQAHLPLRGKRAIVTSGPTREYIDPVRYISNESSGKQGHAIAQALAMAGADTTLVTGPVSIADPKGVRIVRVTTAEEMLKACEESLPADIAICAAAVADWRVANTSKQKIKKGKSAPTLELAENPDILAALAKAGNRRPVLLIGFAAETENLIANAQDKLSRKGCDWMVANDVSVGVFNAEENTVHLLRAGSETENWLRMSKDAVARELTEKIITYFGSIK